MVPQTFKFEPDFDACDADRLGETLWRLLRTMMSESDLIDRFHILGPEAKNLMRPGNGTVLPLVGGYALVFDPENDRMRRGHHADRWDIVSVEAESIIATQLDGAHSAPVTPRATRSVVLADPEQIFPPFGISLPINCRVT